MKKLSSKPDPLMAWIYDRDHPDYDSDKAKDLRIRRENALSACPKWMIREAECNDNLGDKEGK